MKWNTKSNAWEVSLRLHPQDLEQALQSEQTQVPTSESGDKTRRKLGIEDPGFDVAVLAFLESHLVLQRTSSAMTLKELSLLNIFKTTTNEKTDADKCSKLKWIGMERERGWLWIHLEMIPPALDPSIHKLWLIHDVLMDHVARQENTMSIDPSSGPKFSLQFKKEDSMQEFFKH